ncbi:hypothetical protein KI387_008123, partial [Taxus chinensis]
MEAVEGNIIINHDFSDGLASWHANSCTGFVSDGLRYAKEVKAESGSQYAVVSNRTECWQGLEQDITPRLSPHLTYDVSAFVRTWGSTEQTANVVATLKLEDPNSAPTFLTIGRATASRERWAKLEGTFSLKIIPSQVIFYLEGPSPGIDLLIDRVHAWPATTIKGEFNKSFKAGHDNIIRNPFFEDGLNNWTGRNCKLVLRDVANDEHLPSGGKHYASATERTQFWNGIQQDISGRAKGKSVYEVSAMVRITGNLQSAEVRATLWVQTTDQREQYITMGKVQASVKDWMHLQGKFLLNPEPAKAVAYLEGPPAGIDILVDSFLMYPAEKTRPSPRPIIENPGYGQNIVDNSNLFDGLKGWFPLGPCSLNIATGSPRVIPPAAQESLGWKQSLSGNYILVTNRSQNWQGPAQIITEKLKLFITYQVTAWVRVGSGGTGAQNVNVALSIDNQWVTGGEVEADVHVWREVAGSFRLEKKPSNVMLYVQGPSAGVDLMVAGLQIFAVDGKARFEHLKKQTQKVRMRDVILKISGAEVKKFHGFCVKVKQIHNSFPLGTCINRNSIDNEDYVAFFVKFFNWAVFENEMKWPWTEPQKGQHNYKDADDLTDLCKCHGIRIRGHCIFWEDQNAVPQWVRALNKEELRAAIQNRIADLLSRYSGRFQHFDVNNEMLHNSFYQERLGKEIWAYMFKMVHQLDPSATLFVNDYHVEDGRDARSSPEKYIDQIVYLQTQGAPVGGIGVQGHSAYPVGSIISSALDKLSVLGLPIWFTEVDVHSANEFVRADDLEVFFREAFAHPAVEGIMLWGFWELAMATEQAHLVDADGAINVTGKRFLALKKEWTTHLEGYTDHQGQFPFRGFHGAYEVEVSLHPYKVKHNFVVDKGDTPL